MSEIRPQPGPQEDFLSTPADIAFYGGAAGGGKTFALLLEAIRNIPNPRFGGVIFRRTTVQVRNEGGLWDESEKIYFHMGAQPKESILAWDFPSGSRLKFAHLEHEKNVYDWQGSQIPFIGFDEVTHFSEKQFFYMLSRNRSMCGVKPYIRATCNPDPKSWVKKFIGWYIGEDGYAIKERSGKIRYFVRINDDIIWANSKRELIETYGAKQEDIKSFTFICASVFDNKILLKQDPSYLANLNSLSKFEREKLRDGNWNASEGEGKIFERGWFKIVRAAPQLIKEVRFWDRAASKPSKHYPDPDWTAGVRMGICKDGMVWIRHIERFREGPAEVRRRIKAIASQESKVTIGLSEDPGQAGKVDIQSFYTFLSGYRIEKMREMIDKETRALPLSAQAEVGNVHLVEGDWNDSFIDEMASFGNGGKDDQVDAATGAYTLLTQDNVGEFTEDLGDLEESSFKLGDW